MNRGGSIWATSGIRATSCSGTANCGNRLWHSPGAQDFTIQFVGSWPTPRLVSASMPTMSNPRRSKPCFRFNARAQFQDRRHGHERARFAQTLSLVGSKMENRIPAETGVAAPGLPASSTRTSNPFCASACAVSAPMMPPPTTQVSISGSVFFDAFGLQDQDLALGDVAVRAVPDRSPPR